MLGNAIFSIISLTIVVIVLTDVFLPTVKAVNQTGWTGGETSLWNVVSLVAIAGFVYNVASTMGLM